jgi:hypothetical protein
LDLPHIVERCGHPLDIASQSRALGRVQRMAAVGGIHLPVQRRFCLAEQSDQPGLFSKIGASIENCLEEAPNQVDQRFNTARG